eukprot:TRINITY_DN10662_c0_g1_i1.p2 TRINITY_DN10662_c0_g1~~TRINITY_DN10662_c0_g1_i1.p2  ORF type:complete len:182 (-),score=15.87 TRINITY_DN10662_c0_g1_i1:18-563(-)
MSLLRCNNTASWWHHCSRWHVAGTNIAQQQVGLALQELLDNSCQNGIQSVQALVCGILNCSTISHTTVASNFAPLGIEGPTLSHSPKTSAYNALLFICSQFHLSSCRADVSQHTCSRSHLYKASLLELEKRYNVRVVVSLHEATSEVIPKTIAELAVTKPDKIASANQAQNQHRTGMLPSP